MRNLFLIATVALSGCTRHPPHSLALLEQDESIVFPENFGPTPVVGRPGKPFALDGVTLQALLVATNDFLPPATKDSPCWDRRDAYAYQVLRQADVIFIEIHADPAACGGSFLMLDSGWKYAISVDGRILKRLQAGEPEWPMPAPASLDAGVNQGQGALDLSGAVEVPQSSSPPRVPWRRLDGGVGSMTPIASPTFPPDGGTSADGGTLEPASAGQTSSGGSGATRH